MSQVLDALHQPHAQLLLRLVLGGVLLLAGVAKLRDMGAFRAAVAEYGVLPRALERPFATTLPWLETGVGALLLVGLGTTAAAAIAAPLFLAFGGAIAINLARGRHFDCHCFGSIQSDPIGWAALVRSGVLVLAALTVAVGTSRFGALEWAVFGSSAELPAAVEVVPVLFMAAVIFDVLVLLPETVRVQQVFWRWQRTRVTGGHRHAVDGAAERSTA